MLPCQCHTAFSERLVFWQCHPSRVNYHLVSIRRRQNMQQSCKVYKSQTLIHYTSQWVRLSIQTHHTGSFCKNQALIFRQNWILFKKASGKGWWWNTKTKSISLGVFMRTTWQDGTFRDHQNQCSLSSNGICNSLNQGLTSSGVLSWASLLKYPRNFKNHPLCLRKKTKCWAKDEFMKWVEGDTVKRVAYIQHSYLTKANLLFTLHSTYAAYKL